MAIAPLAGTPITGTDSGGTATVSVTIPSGTVPDGSLVVVVHCNDFYAFSNMPAPVLSSFSPTMQFWGGTDGGAGQSHIKVWAFDMPVGAAASSRTISVTETGSHDEDKGLAVWAFSGAAAAASALDVLVSSSSASSTDPHVLTGLTAAQAGEYLIGHVRTSGGAGGVTYTWSGGSIVEKFDIANFTQFTGAGELLAASGATGTRTADPTGSTPFMGVLFAVLPAAGGGGAPTWIPAQRSRRPAPARPRRARAAQPPLPAPGPAPQAGQERRPRVIPAPKARARVETPIRAQVNPPYPTNEDAQPRRLRGLLPRRGRVEMPPWPQQAPPVNPDWIAQPRRPRQVPVVLRREHVWMPPWPVQAAPAAPTWIPGGHRPRPLPAPARRDRMAALPVPAAPLWLPGRPRPRPVEPPAPRDRGAAPPSPQTLWLPAPHRPRPPAPVRPRRQERLVIGVAIAPPNPPIVLLQPHHRWLVLPAVRRAQFFGPPLEGVEPVDCVVHRPATGTVARGSTGTIARPFAGIVEFCTCCT